MFSFTKRQIVCLSDFNRQFTDETLALSYSDFAVLDGSADVIWWAICAMNHHKESVMYLDNYLSVGGDAWLKLADESHKLCLRNLNRILRTSSLVKEA